MLDLWRRASEKKETLSIFEWGHSRRRKKEQDRLLEKQLKRHLVLTVYLYREVRSRMTGGLVDPTLAPSHGQSFDQEAHQFYLELVERGRLGHPPTIEELFKNNGTIGISSK